MFSSYWLLSFMWVGLHEYCKSSFWTSNNKIFPFCLQIKESNAGWTLGYMLNLTNMIPAEQPLSPPLPHSTYISLMVLFSLVLVAVAITGLFIYSKPSYFWKEAV